jgi:hypothetical protein
MKRATYFLTALGLSGCFLQQNKPNPPVQPANGGVVGMVAIEDMRGQESGAVFVGIFAPKTNSKSVVSRIAGRPEQSECKVVRSPLAATSALISVGQLSFGTALQSAHVTVEEKENHRYVKVLPPDFPAGTYHVAAGGVGGISPFEAYLQMPEALLDVSVNGQAFGSASVLVRKSDPLVMSWREPAVPNAEHVVAMDIEAKSATENITLKCLAVESSLAVMGGSHLWQIPQDKLAEIPAMKGAKIYFVRAIVKDSITAYLDLRLQGLRTWLTEAEVGD